MGKTQEAFLSSKRVPQHRVSNQSSNNKTTSTTIMGEGNEQTYNQTTQPILTPSPAI